MEAGLYGVQQEWYPLALRGDNPVVVLNERLVFEVGANHVVTSSVVLQDIPVMPVRT